MGNVPALRDAATLCERCRRSGRTDIRRMLCASCGAYYVHFQKARREKGLAPFVSVEEYVRAHPSSLLSRFAGSIKDGGMPPAVEELEEYIEGFMIGGNAMRDVCETIDRIAESDIPVLISGETGAGKELVAHAIHRKSKRSRKPFVIVDCTALSESLIESELFGHERMVVYERSPGAQRAF